MDHSDILSEVFATLRIRSQLYFRAELRGAFSVEVPKERRRIRFHLLRQGRCWIAAPDTTPVELTEGDLALVPNGAAQVLSAEPGAAPVPLPEVLAQGALTRGVLKVGEGDSCVRLLCGFCRFDEAIDHPVLAGLPGLIVLRARDLGGEPWAAAALRLLALEADLDAAGSAGILTRLLEILFIQALRRMTAQPEAAGDGFVAALSDPRLSRALDAIHRAPETAWRIGDLARLAGMSRARFAARFAEVVGLPPIGYLTAWRLMKARALLAESGLDMAEIASRCGYASVPSFSRRFKTAFGVGPGSYRREARPG